MDESKESTSAEHTSDQSSFPTLSAMQQPTPPPAINFEQMYVNPYEISSVKLPNFWEKAPAAWFIAAEAQFATKKITKDETKYSYVLASLPIDAINNIIDVLNNPLVSNKYGNLKEVLIKRHSLSEQRRLEQLLSAENLGDRKPSDLYRHMTSTAGNISLLCEDLIKSLWERKLPTQISIPLAVTIGQPFQTRLDLADKIWETTQTLSVNAIQQPSDSRNISNNLSNVEERLMREINEIKSSLKKLSFRDRGRSPHRSVSFQNGKRSNRSNSNRRTCWFHRVHGVNARNCKPPCSFNNKNANEKN